MFSRYFNKELNFAIFFRPNNVKSCALPAKVTYTEASMKNQGHPITFSEYNYMFIVLSKFGILMVQLLQKLS